MLSNGLGISALRLLLGADKVARVDDVAEIHIALAKVPIRDEQDFGRSQTVPRWIVAMSNEWPMFFLQAVVLICLAGALFVRGPGDQD